MPIWVLAAVTILAPVELDFSLVLVVVSWLWAAVRSRMGRSKVVRNFFIIDTYVMDGWKLSLFCGGMEYVGFRINEQVCLAKALRI